MLLLLLFFAVGFACVRAGLTGKSFFSDRVPDSQEDSNSPLSFLDGQAIYVIVGLIMLVLALAFALLIWLGRRTK